MTCVIVSLDEWGGFSLPARILQETGWKTGDKLAVEVADTKLRMYSVERAIRNTPEDLAIGVPTGVSLADDLNREQHPGVAHEEPLP